MNWQFALWRRCRWRVARRGGNYNNTSNTGPAYLNFNNNRSNANTNYGGRPRSRIWYHHSVLPDYGSAGFFVIREGHISHRPLLSR
ncbi:MAG: hypothetical protein IJ153_05650 [Clostridia bacterium]|nr:hypothetical protein [Clostridia bacterium]MBQ9211169.1 hypothetical protein [Clostridia bacterium]